MIRALLLTILCAAISRATVAYRVRLSASEGGRIVTIPAERYVAAVLAGEAGTFRNEESLKAIAVAARTYAAHFHSRHMAHGYDFCSTTHCQRLILKDAGGRFLNAAEATRGQLLWYQSKPALAVYTQDCGGQSESARAPYLLVHKDPYCTAKDQGRWSWASQASRIREALTTAGLQSPQSLSRIIIRERTSSGRARTLSLIGNSASIPISAGSFRLAIGRTLGWNTLRSDWYEVQSINGTIRFQGRGKGNGAGLCQDGADEMAAQGYTYRQILSFYYPGTTVSVLANDVKWTKYRGVHATIFTGERGIGNRAAKITEAEIQNLQSRYNLLPPPGLAIYIYPTMDSYRNGTGEPGWVAAHTVGRRVEMQPFDTLEKHGGFGPVLRHELLHTIIEAEAKPGTPLWFREGLVEELAGNPSPLNHNEPRPARESSIAKRDDPARTRAAYNAAAERVARLRARYGTAVLLRWVKEGIPDEITRSSTSRNPANSR
jgi:stage II sporulation protein D